MSMKRAYYSSYKERDEITINISELPEDVPYIFQCAENELIFKLANLKRATS